MPTTAHPAAGSSIQSATMAVLSTNEEIAGRFAPYLEELHELFTLHGVRFGTPADLPGLVHRLESDSLFAEDVSSILRSIILREGGSVPQTELLEVLALAAAGTELDPALPEVQPSFRRLLGFVGTVVRRPWNVPPNLAAAAAPPAPAEILPHAMRGEQQDAVAVSSSQPSGLASVRKASNPFARTESAPRPKSSPHSEAGESPHAGMDRIPRPHSSRNPSWPLWIAAACAILAVFLLISMNRTPSPAAPGKVASLPPQPATFPTQSSAQPLQPAGVPAQPATVPASAAPSPAPSSAPSSATALPRPSAAARGTANPVSRPGAPQRLHPSAAAPATAPGTDRRIIAGGHEPARMGTPDAAKAAPPVAMRSAPQGPAPSAASPRGVATAEGGSASVSGARAGTAASTTSNLSGAAELRRPAIALPRAGNGHGAYFQVSSGVMASHLLNASDPAYPLLARVAHVQGQVILQAVISTEGEVVATHVLSGHRLLRGAAASAVKRWRYRPFLVDGHPVNVATIVTVEFHEHG